MAGRAQLWRLAVTPTGPQLTRLPRGPGALLSALDLRPTALVVCEDLANVPSSSPSEPNRSAPRPPPAWLSAWSPGEGARQPSGGRTHSAACSAAKGTTAHATDGAWARRRRHGHRHGTPETTHDPLGAESHRGLAQQAAGARVRSRTSFWVSPSLPPIAKAPRAFCPAAPRGSLTHEPSQPSGQVPRPLATTGRPPVVAREHVVGTPPSSPLPSKRGQAIPRGPEAPGSTQETSVLLLVKGINEAKGLRQWPMAAGASQGDEGTRAARQRRVGRERRRVQQDSGLHLAESLRSDSRCPQGYCPGDRRDADETASPWPVLGPLTGALGSCGPAVVEGAELEAMGPSVSLRGTRSGSWPGPGWCAWRGWWRPGAPRGPLSCRLKGGPGSRLSPAPRVASGAANVHTRACGRLRLAAPVQAWPLALLQVLPAQAWTGPWAEAGVGVLGGRLEASGKLGPQGLPGAPGKPGSCVWLVQPHLPRPLEAAPRGLRGCGRGWGAGALLGGGCGKLGAGLSLWVPPGDQVGDLVITERGDSVEQHPVGARPLTCRPWGLGAQGRPARRVRHTAGPGDKLAWKRAVALCVPDLTSASSPHSHDLTGRAPGRGTPRHGPLGTRQPAGAGHPAGGGGCRCHWLPQGPLFLRRRRSEGAQSHGRRALPARAHTGCPPPGARPSAVLPFRRLCPADAAGALRFRLMPGLIASPPGPRATRAGTLLRSCTPWPGAPAPCLSIPARVHLPPGAAAPLESTRLGATGPLPEVTPGDPVLGRRVQASVGAEWEQGLESGRSGGVGGGPQGLLNWDVGAGSGLSLPARPSATILDADLLLARPRAWVRQAHGTLSSQGPGSGLTRP
ncbi:collagen, type I, alpha 1b-like [Odocoileus virginianus]|uniref:Collagen, type I, alpha 1b-like n=1 Tax=Odocoileus virginianus TaxID=9874 RepID=A0ABM4HVI7_ODOVR